MFYLEVPKTLFLSLGQPRLIFNHEGLPYSKKTKGYFRQILALTLIQKDRNRFSIFLLLFDDDGQKQILDRAIVNKQTSVDSD